MVIRNYKVKGSVTIPSAGEPTANDVEILTGSAKSTIVKSLEINAGSEDSIVYVIRKDDTNTEYSKIKLDITAYNYVVLWEGFFVIPSGHKLILNADSNEIECIANVVEM